MHRQPHIHARLSEIIPDRARAFADGRIWKVLATANMSTPRYPSPSSLAEDHVPRTHKTNVVGTSHHPEYNINRDLPHFKRGPTGKRLAPVSQFNSAAGRELAKETRTEHTMGSGSIPQVNFANKKLQNDHSVESSRPRNFSRTWPTPLSDRDTLPSQTQNAYVVSHNTSTAFVAHGRPIPIRSSSNEKLAQASSPPPQKKESEKEKEKEKPCPLCAHLPPTSSSSYSSFSHICTHCHRFVFHAPPSPPGITALHLDTPHPPPIPPRKPVPTPLKCERCIAIPGALVDEFREVFAEAVCLVCGCLSAEGVAGIREMPAEVREGVSKELMRWLGGVFERRGGREGSRGDVDVEVKQREGNLKRKGAVRRGRSGKKAWV